MAEWVTAGAVVLMLALQLTVVIVVLRLTSAISQLVEGGRDALTDLRGRFKL